LFTIKPLDIATIISNAKATGGRIITVEDHYPEGGLGTLGMLLQVCFRRKCFCFA
jgi:transketolase C-terminal domain/subunit